ncbi:hypothetical protein [Leyella lascolaii]|uniref:hypothetical protein n=1 Tax=Leyella lascolaii TaxID=1776379 RepID=UPI00083A830A|nr:hypothetical protein [Leyella lascolaii]
MLRADSTHRRVPDGLFGGAGSVFPCDDNGSPMMRKSLFHTPKEAFQQDVKSRAEPWLVLIALMSSALR